MQTQLPSQLLATEPGRRADAILRSCVHCGMCNAVCPTYQLLGDELDGPRGRIYLIKEMLENPDMATPVSSAKPDALSAVPSGGGTGGRAAAKAALSVVRTHLDRCLGCRGCEVACPSGVQYGELLEIGREFMEQPGVARAPLQRLIRHFFGWLAPSPGRFAICIRLGRLGRWMLPSALAKLLPRRTALPVGDAAPPPPTAAPTQRALLLRGCVQRLTTPAVNAAAARLLAANGVEPLWAEGEQCCGGLNLHLGQKHKARRIMRQTIDALRPRLDEVDVIVSTASGCGITVKDYGRLLADDPDYAAAAAAVAAKTRDLAEVAASFTHLSPANNSNGSRVGAGTPPTRLSHQLPAKDAAAWSATSPREHPSQATLGPESARGRGHPSGEKDRLLKLGRAQAPPPASLGRIVAWHAPCTLRHGQGITGLVENLLSRAGYQLLEVRDSHICCGSAGIYSLLQRRLANQLREDKLANLMAGGPDLIVTANVGCQMHLGAVAPVPVLHWAELLAPRSANAG